LGHATRCVPIINALIKSNFEPIIASDGDALKLLQQEFPNLKSFELPSYYISYSKKRKFFKFKLLSKLPKVLRAVKKEKKEIAKIVKNEQISGIISDNRFGARSSSIPSVYITHQIQVLSGNTTWLTSKIHRKIINKFDECWIPDEVEQTFSGKLSNTEKLKIPFKFIGILSRFKPKYIDKKYDLLVILSGVEPQRTILELSLLKQLNNYSGAILFVRGVLNSEEMSSSIKNIKIKNYLLSKELEKAINQSEIVLARSGYSTIMDLAILQKKAFFIPTLGQNEQEYLALFLKENRLVPFKKQQDFNISNLKEIENFNGFEDCNSDSKIDLNTFSLF